MHFTSSLKLEAKDPLKLTIVQAFNNTLNIFSKNPIIILYHFYSLNNYEYEEFHQHQYLDRKLDTYPFSSVCFKLLAEESFEIFLKRTG